MLAGGFGASKAATEDIQALVDGLKGEIEAHIGSTFSVFKATTYTSQVVAGTNYLVDIEVDGGKTVKVKIFKPLPHVQPPTPQLTEASVV